MKTPAQATHFLIASIGLIAAVSGCAELYVPSFEGWIANDEPMAHHYRVTVEFPTDGPTAAVILDRAALLQANETISLGTVGSQNGVYRITAVMDNHTTRIDERRWEHGHGKVSFTVGSWNGQLAISWKYV